MAEDNINKLLEQLKDKESQLERVRFELEIQSWGLKKTNEGIRILYKELEKKNIELRQLDQMKSDFLSVVSHELRTPLATIKETVSQMLDGALGPTTPKQQEFLSMCLDNILRLVRIINNLLDLSKIEAGKTELKKRQVDMAELIKRVCLSFSSRLTAKKLAIRTRFSPESMDIYIDEDKVIQVLNNLIGNSIKFTKEGFIEVSAQDKGEFIECSVSDTGRGMSEDNLAHLFGKFEQFAQSTDPSEKGTGLGLAITKGIIDLHHGKIWAESRLEKGSKFVFTLPKCSSCEVLKEHIADNLKSLLRTEETISVIVLELKGLSELEKKIGRSRTEPLFYELSKILEELLPARPAGGPARGRMIIEADAAFCILNEITKAQALSVKDSLLLKTGDFLATNNLEKDIATGYKVLNFPEDGSTAEQICEGL